MDDPRRTKMGVGAVEPPPEPSRADAAPPALQRSEIPHAVQPPHISMPVQTLSRHFVGISLRRAFRLHIRNDEVLPSERIHLETRARHVRDPDQQAFLAWRRSVLLLVAIMFVPLSVFRFIEAFDGPPLPPLGRAFMLLPAFAELIFCVVAFDQLRNWAQWKKQRRIMLIAWGLYFVAPFIVYVYPFRSAFDDSIYLARAAAEIGGVKLKASSSAIHMVVGLAFGVQALIALGPKVISLMPGLIRASVVSKLLFPGTSAPGWLMVLAAPFYALFAYIIMLLPYQLTGSWEFVAGIAGILLAQVFIAVSGRRLSVPLTTSEAAHRIHRTWWAYIGLMVVAAVFLVYGMVDFISELHLGYVRVVTGVLAVVSNILLDTLIGTDAIIAAMAHFRRKAVPDPVHEQLLHDAEVKLDTFCN